MKSENSRSGWKMTEPGKPVQMPSSVSSIERNSMAATILSQYKNLYEPGRYLQAVKEAVHITDALIEELDRTRKPMP